MGKKKVKATENLAKDVKPKVINTNGMNVTELKAIAYDLIVQLEKTQSDLKGVNDLIIQKQEK